VNLFNPVRVIFATVDERLAFAELRSVYYLADKQRMITPGGIVAINKPAI
jgi:hypothetical protein